MDKELIKKELKNLINEGRDIYYAGVLFGDKNYFQNLDEAMKKEAEEAVKKIKHPNVDYQVWYDKACRVVRIFIPERLEEFERFYTGSKTVKKKDDLDFMTAGITHYFQGRSITQNNKEVSFLYTFEINFRMQINILAAIKKNVDHVLFNLESEIQYGLSKSEIDVAKELQKNKHLREAGVIAGLVIELHLKNIAKNRNIKLPINPQMKHYNEALKGKAYDATITKQIELCSIIRNKCAHASDNSPTDYEIDTIISSAEIIIATVNS